MPRWEPDARERFVIAALHLFNEHGYDETTVAQIADQAGLTKSTFFRHFADKREVLAAGQETLSRLLAEGIAAAPLEASPLAAVDAGLTHAAASMTPFNRELGPRLEAVIATSSELQERAVLKRVGMTAAMADALRLRGVDDSISDTAAELRALAFKAGFEAWVAEGNELSLGELTSAALRRYHAATRRLD